ncbi:MAG: DUF433 domain-containing protein [Bacteroidetes bacterium]|nr:DUF433 domain-containing protein [Bacteroidota bacterium]MBU1718019.1 DUF433 domain-containing protein [Bacteroidota bacterium]
MSNVIHVDQEILGGTPVFAGTRVPIKNLFDYLEDGGSTSGFLNDFPSVKDDQVNAVLDIARHLLLSISQISHENIA